MALHDWLAGLRGLITPAARAAAGPPTEGAGPESEDTALPPEALWSPEERRGGRAGRTRLLLGVIILAGGAWLGLRYLAAPSPPPPLGSLITATGRLPAPVSKAQEGDGPARPPAPVAAEAPAPFTPAPAPRVGLPAEPPPAPPVLDRAEPPPALGLAREPQALAEDAVRMSYALTLAEREMRLAEFGARKQKAEAERAKAAADAKEAAAWIAALERDPKLAIRVRLPEKEKTEPKAAGPVVPGRAGGATLPTFPALPLSPPSPPPAPKVEAPPPPPMPPAETITVRLIDHSAPAGPEALLAVNGQTVAVRPGDQVGAWEVVEVTPAGVRLAADYDGVRQEQWRPLPAPFAQGSAVPAAPPSPPPAQSKTPVPAAPTPARKAAPAHTAPPRGLGPSGY